MLFLQLRTCVHHLMWLVFLFRCDYISSGPLWFGWSLRSLDGEHLVGRQAHLLTSTSVQSCWNDQASERRISGFTEGYRSAALLGLGFSVQFQLDLSSWSFYSLRDREDGGVLARRRDADIQKNRGFVGR